jgi:hypothetical protein
MDDPIPFYEFAQMIQSADYDNLFCYYESFKHINPYIILYNAILSNDINVVKWVDKYYNLECLTIFELLDLYDVVCKYNNNTDIKKWLIKEYIKNPRQFKSNVNQNHNINFINKILNSINRFFN